MKRSWSTSMRVIAGISLGLASVHAQQIAERTLIAPSVTAVRAIEPPATLLPEETSSVGITRFSFVAYGDTRSANDPNMPGDGQIIQAEHSRLADRIILKAREVSSTPFPIRFVLQSGDAVLRGNDAAMWNVSFIPIIERLTRTANVQYFFAVGNHDVAPDSENGRPLGLRNTFAAMSKLIPAEGAPRRLNGYPTYAFGYGNSFFIALDSNIPGDPMQFAWATNQLEHLDRKRYPHLIAFFHHPPFSSGPHSRVLGDPAAPEPQTAAIRNLWLPLFRKHHVDLTITGHDHLFDHWVEHYVDRGMTYRMDHVVTGGGGAPSYAYVGEPDLRAYVLANATQAVRLDHLMKPGPTPETNPHHFVTIRVDGDRLSLEVTGIGPNDYKPYNGQATIALRDGST